MLKFVPLFFCSMLFCYSSVYAGSACSTAPGAPSIACPNTPPNNWCTGVAPNCENFMCVNGVCVYSP